MNNLNLEQEFKIKSYVNYINTLSNKKVKKYLKEALKKMVIKDNMIRYFIKKSIN